MTSISVWLPHMYIGGNDEQPKSSFEAYLISKTNLLTPFDSLASSSSFKFTTAASAAAKVDPEIDDKDNGPVEASPGGDTKESPCDILDQSGLAARVTGNGVLVYDDGMSALAPKKEERQVRFFFVHVLAVCTNVHSCAASTLIHAHGTDAPLNFLCTSLSCISCARCAPAATV